MKYNMFLFAAIVFGFLACSQPEEFSGGQPEITGSWINQQVIDSIYTYQKAKTLKDNEYCFSVYPDGKFIERKNSGWCGTPPVSYADYEGSWTLKDSVLTISVPYWGGNSTSKWKIISVDDTHMSIVYLDQVFENME